MLSLVPPVQSFRTSGFWDSGAYPSTPLVRHWLVGSHFEEGVPARTFREVSGPIKGELAVAYLSFLAGFWNLNPSSPISENLDECGADS